MSNDVFKISISYNNKELLIDLNKQENNLFQTFIKLINDALNEQNIESNFKITTLNTNIPYLLVDENNFLSILYEKTPENILKLLLNKNEINQDNSHNNEKEDEPLQSGIMKMSSFSDDFNDDAQEEINNKSNDNIINNMSNNEGNLDKNKNEMEENKTDKHKDDNKDNIVLQINNSIESKINEPYSSNNSISDIFNHEICSICKNRLSQIKYICTICEHCIICSSCEDFHQHPCFKYKTKFLSSLKETYNFISKPCEQQLNSSFLSLLIQKTYDIKIIPITDLDICLRPNKGVFLPIKIINDSKTVLNSSKFIILISGNYLINISYNCSDYFNIREKGGEYILRLKCITPSKLCKETINVIIFSSELNLKENGFLKIKYNITINEDIEEEKLNEKLIFIDFIDMFSKEHKKIIENLIENELKGYSPDYIINILFKNNWNIIEAINEIKNNNI